MSQDTPFQKVSKGEIIPEYGVVIFDDGTIEVLTKPHMDILSTAVLNEAQRQAKRLSDADSYSCARGASYEEAVANAVANFGPLRSAKPASEEGKSRG